MSKSSRPQVDDKLNEPIDCFALLNQHKNLENVEMEGKYIMPKNNNLQSIQKQITKETYCKVAIDKRTKPNIQTPNWETFTMVISGWIIKKLDRIC